MKRFIVGAIAAATLLVAVPAWAAIGEPTDLPGVDIVPSILVGEEEVQSTAAYFIDDAGTKRAIARFALADTSLTRGAYAVLFYDRDGDLIPVGAQIVSGDGVNPFVLFEGQNGAGVRIFRETDDVLFVCGISYFRGKIRDLAGYNSSGRCSTQAGAMEVGLGLSPGGAGSFG